MSNKMNQTQLTVLWEINGRAEAGPYTLLGLNPSAFTLKLHRPFLTLADIAHLCKQIEAEYRTTQQGLRGLEGTDKDRYINWRTVRLEILTDELRKLVGDEEAARIVNQIADKPEEGQK
jgi:hypothetical protein